MRLDVSFLPYLELVFFDCNDQGCDRNIYQYGKKLIWEMDMSYVWVLEHKKPFTST